MPAAAPGSRPCRDLAASPGAILCLSHGQILPATPAGVSPIPDGLGVLHRNNYNWTLKSPSRSLISKRPLCAAETHFVVFRKPPNANRCTLSKLEPPRPLAAASCVTT